MSFCHTVVLHKLEQWNSVSEFEILIFTQEEGTSVLLDAFEHITRLQKSVDDLKTELIPLCNPATLSAFHLNEESLEEASAAQSTSADSICVLYHHPMVHLRLHLHT